MPKPWLSDSGLKGLGDSRHRLPEKTQPLQGRLPALWAQGATPHISCTAARNSAGRAQRPARAWRAWPKAAQGPIGHGRGYGQKSTLRNARVRRRANRETDRRRGSDMTARTAAGRADRPLADRPFLPAVPPRERGHGRLWATGAGQAGPYTGTAASGAAALRPSIPATHPKRGDGKAAGGRREQPRTRAPRPSPMKRVTIARTGTATQI